MRFCVISILALGTSLSFASPVSNVTERWCGVTYSPEEMSAAEAHFTTNRVNVSNLVVIPVPKVRVYWHVISAGRGLSQGNIPDKHIKKSISATNKHFGGTIKFTLAGITRTTNAKWFKLMGTKDFLNTQMTKSLRRGGPETLNVYSVGFKKTRLLGYATSPWHYRSYPKEDGVVILYSSVPGGSTAKYNQGKTLTHEVGHWLGLYHTFDGGCHSPGDHVSDTPAEKKPAYRCQIGRNTYPGGGPDPVNNYMDYSYDYCMNKFTNGQITRIRSQLATYRGL